MKLKNLLKRVWLFILFTGTMFLGLFASFFLAGPSAKNSIVNYDTAMNSLAAGAPTAPQFSPRPDGITPDDLFTVPVLSQVTDSQQITQLWHGIKNLKLDIQDIMAIIPNKLKLVAGAFAVGGSKFLKEADADKDVFMQTDKVAKQYAIMNQFNPTLAKTTVLKISKPLRAIDIFTSGNQAAADASVTIPANFMYEVAEIPLASALAKESIVFNYKDMASSKPGDHDYQLVFSNSNNELKSLGAKGAPVKTIQELVRNNTIFVRDAKAATPYDYKNPSVSIPAPIRDKIVLQEVGTGMSARIKIFIKPDGTNDQVHPINFSISDSTPDTSKNIFKYGILDDSLSPLHIKQLSDDTLDQYPAVKRHDPVEPANSILGDITKGAPSISNSIAVHHIASSWKKETNYGLSGGEKILNGNHLRFYMAPGTKWTTKLRFMNEGSDVFDGQNNEVFVKFSAAGVPEIKPARFAITQTKFAQASNVSPISLTTKTLNPRNAGDEKILQVDFVLQAGVTSISPLGGVDENDYVFDSFVNKIFFEPPSTIVPTVVPASMRRKIVIEALTTSTNRYKTILGDVYKNWSKSVGSPTDPAYIRPLDHAFTQQPANLKMIPTIKDWPTFNYKYEDPRKGSSIDKTEIGTDILATLNKFTNELADEESIKFKEKSVREQDYYLAKDPSTSIMIVEQRLVKNTGKAGEKLIGVAKALVAYWMGAPISSDDQDILDKFKDDYKKHLIPWNITNDVYDLSKPDAKTGVWAKTPAYFASKQVVYHLIEPYLAKAIEQAFVLEKVVYETIKGGLLGIYMTKYLNSSSDSAVGINLKSIHKFSDGELPSSLKGMHLTSVDGETTEKVADGTEELRSLVSFISQEGLQDKYLQPADIVKFNNFVKSGEIFDASSYSDDAKKLSTRDMIALIDRITKQISGNNKDFNDYSLTKITRDISEGNLSADPVGKIRHAVQTVIHKITSGDETFKYTYFTHTSASTYLQNLVMGRNIKSIVRKYEKIHPKLTARELSDLSLIDDGAYNEKVITQVAVNMEYYNLWYFIDQLTTRKGVPQIAEEMLGSKMQEELVIKIPKGNEFINSLSDSSVLVKYSFLAAGIIMFIIGVAATSITFRKSTKSNSASKSSLLTFRIVFAGFAVSGLVVSLLGLLTDML